MGLLKMLFGGTMEPKKVINWHVNNWKTEMDADEIAIATTIARKAIGDYGPVTGFYNVKCLFGDPRFYFGKLEKGIRQGHEFSFKVLRRIAECPVTDNSNWALSILQRLKKEGVLDYIFDKGAELKEMKVDGEKVFVQKYLEEEI